jgi:hypothetical protein
VSLAEARDKRLAARKQLAQGVDPGRTKREEKQAKEKAALNTFEAVARAWLARTAAERAASTQEKNTAWLERNIFPAIGALPISTIKPWDVLSALRVIENRGAIESAHKIKQLCGQVFRVGPGIAPLISSAYLCCSNATVYSNNHVILADAFHWTRP